MLSDQETEKELRSKKWRYTGGCMTPLIIKISLTLWPPMLPLSKGVGVRGRRGSGQSTTFSYHDMTSNDGENDFSSTPETSVHSLVMSESSVSSADWASTRELVTKPLFADVTLFGSAGPSSATASSSPSPSNDTEGTVPSKIWPKESSTEDPTWRALLEDCAVEVPNVVMGFVVENVVVMRCIGLGGGLGWVFCLLIVARILWDSSFCPGDGSHHHSFMIS